MGCDSGSNLMDKNTLYVFFKHRRHLVNGLLFLSSSWSATRRMLSPQTILPSIIDLYYHSKSNVHFNKKTKFWYNYIFGLHIICEQTYGNKTYLFSLCFVLLMWMAGDSITVRNKLKFGIGAFLTGAKRLLLYIHFTKMSGKSQFDERW